MVKKITLAGTPAEIDFEDSAVRRIDGLLSGGARVGIACSGGADSVLLLRALAEIFAESKTGLVVVHYNHRVRADADADELFVKNACEGLGVKCVCGRPDFPPEKISEDTLRDLRLGFFSECSLAENLSCIAQGHHRSDVAETVLMRLARGSGLDGLCAPRAVSRVGTVEFARPLLRMSRGQIRQILERAKISWREDSSNSENDFFRNKIRNLVLPVLREASNSDFETAACRTRKLLEEDSNALAEFFEREYLAANSDRKDLSEMSLSAATVSLAALARRAVVRFLSENGLSVRARAVDAFVEKMAYGSSRVKMSAGGAEVIFDFSAKTMRAVRFETAEEFEILLKVGKNKLPDGSSVSVKKVSLTSTRRESLKSGDNDDSVCAYIDLKAVGNAADGCVIARSRRDGDAYAPIGSKTPKKLKDIISAKKVPIWKRKLQIIVCNKKGEILWSPALPPSDKYKITDAGAALELTYSPPEC